MIFHITELSDYASQIIQNKTHGSVHSVYRNTVNITVNGWLLALQTAGSPLSPISLITNLTSDEMADLSLENGQEVRFDYSCAKLHDLAPKNPVSHDARHGLYKNFSQVIKRSETGGFDLIFQMSPKVNQDLILTAAESKIHMANTFYHKNLFAESISSLCELIGLGKGLTPCGDDFLCGILAGLHLQGHSTSPFAKELKNAIFQNLSRTNDISQAFLSCALDGQFSLAVNRLWNEPDADQIAHDFQAIGHSSGMDTLCGIYFLFFLME